MTPEAFNIDASIARDTSITDRCRMMTVNYDDPDASAALTRVVCLEIGCYGNRDASKVLLIPFTGLRSEAWVLRCLVEEVIGK